MISALLMWTFLGQLEPVIPPRPVTQVTRKAEQLAPVVNVRKLPERVNRRNASASKNAFRQHRSAGNVLPVARRESSTAQGVRQVAKSPKPKPVVSQVPGAVDTVVVVPQMFIKSLEPWLQHRSSQGHQISVVDPDDGAIATRNAIRKLARGGQLRYVVLVGDSEPTAHLDPAIQARNMPTFLEPARVNIKWGSEPEIATDNPYADLDEDGVPDLAVGRIPANSNLELQRFVEKILNYEKQPRVGPWQRRVNFVAGVGDFGVITDAIIESVSKRIITNGIRPEYDISMTYGSWRSPYCPAPRRFRDITLQRINEGSLFWVYIGHGRLDALDEIRIPNHDDPLPIFEKEDIARLNCRSGQPIALMLACYTGAFDHSQECLAEQMVMSPRGPVAAIAGSRVTMPYAMSIMGTGMLESFFSRQCVTVGDLMLQGKRHLATSQSDKIISRKLLDSLARAIHANNDDVAAERLEHQLLFNLLGDPLLRIPVPQAVLMKAPGRVTGGKTFLVQGTSPIGGAATIELVCRRDRMRMRTNRRMRYDDSEGSMARMNKVYDFANDKRWNAVQTQIKSGPFQARLRVPPDAQGHSHVRVVVQGRDSYALGTQDIYIQPPKNLAEAAK